MFSKHNYGFKISMKKLTKILFENVGDESDFRRLFWKNGKIVDCMMTKTIESDFFPFTI